MNYYDFYAVTATSVRKRDLAGIPADRITTETRWVNYGRRSYPRRAYVGAVTYVEATDGRAAVDAAEAAARVRFPNATVTSAYHARD